MALPGGTCITERSIDRCPMEAVKINKETAASRCRPGSVACLQMQWELSELWKQKQRDHKTPGTDSVG